MNDGNRSIRISALLLLCVALNGCGGGEPVNATEERFVLAREEIEYDGDAVIDEIVPDTCNGASLLSTTEQDGDWGDDVVADGGRVRLKVWPANE